MQTILLTGANGFLGNYLSQILTTKYKVIATGKGACRINVVHENFKYLPLDFTDPKEIESLFISEKPDIVIHAGAISKPDECELNKKLAFDTNVSSTQFLLDQARQFQSYFLFVSTDFIFDGVKGMYSENDIPSPANYYGLTKLLAEKAVEQYPFDWSIVRTVLVYGNPQSGRDNILTIVAKNLKEGKVSKIVNDQVRTPTYIEDLASAIKTIIDKRAKGIYHISGNDVLTPYQMCIAVAHYLQLDEKLIEPVDASTFQQPALRPPKTGFTIEKAVKELNYKPTSFQEGLRRTFTV